MISQSASLFINPQAGLAYQRLCPECRTIDTSDSEDETCGESEIRDIFNAAMQSELDDLRCIPQGIAMDTLLKVVLPLLLFSSFYFSSQIDTLSPFTTHLSFYFSQSADASKDWVGFHLDFKQLDAATSRTQKPSQTMLRASRSGTQAAEVQKSSQKQHAKTQHNPTGRAVKAAYENYDSPSSSDEFASAFWSDTDDNEDNEGSGNDINESGSSKVYNSMPPQPDSTPLEEGPAYTVEDYDDELRLMQEDKDTLEQDYRNVLKEIGTSSSATNGSVCTRFSIWL